MGIRFKFSVSLYPRHRPFPLFLFFPHSPCLCLSLLTPLLSLSLPLLHPFSKSDQPSTDVTNDWRPNVSSGRDRHYNSTGLKFRVETVFDGHTGTCFIDLGYSKSKKVSNLTSLLWTNVPITLKTTLVHRLHGP